MTGGHTTTALTGAGRRAYWRVMRGALPHPVGRPSAAGCSREARR